uniref:Transmembrane protein n=1 Tax=Mycena chlorophos TaxID=658473 RepID=A0ABQ0MB63_MYCCL|nr:predicted protein [Mycena chlorophos]
MPSNYTIDNVSPLINYSGSWAAGNSTDPDSSKYSNNGTFTVSSAKGDTATLIFTGTRVWLFGAKRNNHGGYSVKVDGNTPSNFNGFASTAVFQQPLFDSGSLAQQQHTVTITNLANDTSEPYLDLDFITWTTNSDSPTDQVDDGSPLFVYQPSSSWKTNLGSSFSGFQNNTGHLTSDNNATATITFAGESVVVYGAVGPSQGSYSVQLDGSDAGTYNAHNPTYHAQQSLFQTDSLGSGNHTLVFTNQPSGTQNGLAIDFALMAALPTSNASAAASAGSSTGTSPLPTTTHRTDPTAEGFGNLKKGLFVAAGLGGVCLLFSLIAVIYRCSYRRSLRKAVRGGTTNVAAFTGENITLQKVRDPHADTRPLLGA